MAIHDKTRPQIVGRQLLPDIVAMPMQLQMRTVAKMSAHSGPGLHCMTNNIRVGCGMPYGDDNPCRNKSLDHCQGTWDLRRQGHHANASACSFLQPEKLLPVHVARVSKRMGAAGAILARDPRTLQMQRRDASAYRWFPTDLIQSCEASREMLE